MQETTFSNALTVSIQALTYQELVQWETTGHDEDPLIPEVPGDVRAWSRLPAEPETRRTPRGDEAPPPFLVGSRLHKKIVRRTGN